MLSPKRTVNEPPSAAEATRSDAGDSVTTSTPACARHDRVVFGGRVGLRPAAAPGERRGASQTSSDGRSRGAHARFSHAVR